MYKGNGFNGLWAVAMLLLYVSICGLTFANPSDVKWVNHDVSGYAVTLGPDDTIYLKGMDDVFYTIDPEGQIISQTTYGEPDHRPAGLFVGRNGNYYITENIQDKDYQNQEYSYLTAYNAAGKRQWQQRLAVGTIGEINYPGIHPNGNIILPVDGMGGGESKIYSISETGNTEWTVDLVNPQYPTIAGDGTIYTVHGSSLHILSAISAEGKLLWNLDFKASFGATFVGISVVDEEGVMYIKASADDKIMLASVDKGGSIRWRKFRSNFESGYGLLSKNGELIYGTNSGLILFLDKDTGNSISSIRHDFASIRGITLAENGNLYVFTKRALYSLTPEGKINWEFSDGRTHSNAYWHWRSPVIASDGTIYFATDSGLYAIEGEGSRLDYSSPWPTFRQNFGRTSSFVDTDRDGLVDFVDPDDDDDRIPDVGDLFPFDSTRGGDIDGDGIDSIEDEDDDGDGLLDEEDAFPVDASEWQDSDMDGVGNNADEDDDNDTILDENDLDALDSDVGAVAGDGIFRFKSLNREGQSTSTSVSIAKSGMLVSSNKTGVVQAYSKDGAFLWESDVAAGRLTMPTLDDAGNIYAGSFDFNVYSVDPLGNIRWTFRSDGRVIRDLAIDYDGNIYFGDEAHFYSVNNEGQLNWKYDVTSRTHAPAISDSGTVYLVHGAFIEALDLTGTRRWSYKISNNFNSSPAIGPEGIVQVFDDSGVLYALSEQGLLLWQLETNSTLLQSPVIDALGTTYLASEQGSVFSISSSGQINWQYAVNEEMLGAPLLGDNNVLYIATTNRLTALTDSGEARWQQEVHEGIASIPNMDDDGIAYFGTNNGRIFAFNTASTGLMESYWPRVSGGAMGQGRLPVTSISPKKDFNGDGKADILYRSEDDLTWRMDLMDENGLIESIDMEKMSSCCGWIFNGIGDFNGDGYDDVIIRNTRSGQWYSYNLQSGKVIEKGYVPLESAIDMGIQAVADFNNDGYADILTRNEVSGEWKITLLKNRTITAEIQPPMSKVLKWELVDAQDLDGNGSTDILIRNTSSGAWYHYLFDNTDIIKRDYIESLPQDLDLQVRAMADFNGDKTADLLLQDSENEGWMIVPMEGSLPMAPVTVLDNFESSWQFNSAGDYDGDGITDITVRDTESGNISILLWGDMAVKSEIVSQNPVAEPLKVQTLN